MVSDISRRDISNAALVGTVNFFAFLQVDYFREREKERESVQRERGMPSMAVYTIPLSNPVYSAKRVQWVA